MIGGLQSACASIVASALGSRKRRSVFDGRVFRADPHDLPKFIKERFDLLAYPRYQRGQLLAEVPVLQHGQP